MCAAKRCGSASYASSGSRSEEHTSELQSQSNLVCRLLLEKKKNQDRTYDSTSPLQLLQPVESIDAQSDAAHLHRDFPTGLRRQLLGLRAGLHYSTQVYDGA